MIVVSLHRALNSGSIKTPFWGKLATNEAERRLGGVSEGF